jgi:hypothetical protein
MNGPEIAILAFSVALLLLGVGFGFVIREVRGWFLASIGTKVDVDEATGSARPTVGSYQGGKPASEAGPPPSTPSGTVIPEPEGGQRLPIVEGKMPRIMTYNPKPGNPPRYCQCHGRPLLPGEDVIWWPVPEPKGAVYLICGSEKDLP